MIVNLDDCLKKLDLTLHLSLDSVSVKPTTRTDSATGVNVSHTSGQSFLVHIDATGDCLIWANWYPSTKADGSDITYGANPLFPDGGNAIYTGSAPGSVSDQTIVLTSGFSHIVVRVWSLDKASNTFAALGAIGHCPSSSSSSSSSSSDSSTSSDSSSSMSSSSSADPSSSSTSTVSSSSAKVQPAQPRRR